MGPDTKILQITYADKSLALDCYYIASQFVGSADGLLYSIVPHVNVLRQPLFVSQKGLGINGFVRATVEEQKRNLLIQDLYVDRVVHRMGLGARLLQAQIDYAIRCKLNTVTLLSRPSAVAFYEKMGFVRQGPQRYTMYKTL